MTRLNEIEQERSGLLRQLDALGAEKHKLLMEKHNVRVGMLVEHAGKVYKVTAMRDHTWNDQQPWLYGSLRLKDGTFGKQERTIFTPWREIL
jgi:hypothetical protein